MRSQIHLIAFLLIFVIVLSTFGQQIKPRIAVMPFIPIGVSKNDAQVITGLLKQAL